MAGLFHRVIIESGNAIKYFIYDSLKDTKANFAEALKKISCDRNNINESVACLKSLPADFLNKVVNAIPVTRILHFNLFLVPCPRDENFIALLQKITKNPSFIPSPLIFNELI